jgi:hypothetical protein
MTSGAPVAPSYAVGGGVGATALRLPRPLIGRIGIADRRRVTGLTR